MKDFRETYAKPPERPLATIEKIISIHPIENADNIEVARVLGWDIVVRKVENYKAGDLCIFVQIDAVLPAESWSDFMKDYHYRVRTVRLRKQISQGLVLPLSLLPQNFPIRVGDDVTDALHIWQYVPLQDRIIVHSRYIARASKKLTLLQKIKNFLFVRRETRLRRKVLFPTKLVPKTQEVRIQNAPSILDQHKGDLVHYTEKIDGMSMTSIRKNGKYIHCSRNWILNEKINGDNMKLYLEAFKNSGIEAKLSRYVGDIALQSEIVGPGINGSGKEYNIYKLPTIQTYTFNVWDLERQQYLNQYEFEEFTKKYKILTVPQLGFTKLPGTIEEIVAMSGGKSKINPTIVREGIVVRSQTILRDGRWDFSFKCINPEYLLKYEE